MRRLWAAPLSAVVMAAWAQTPAPEKPADPTALENLGKPMTPKFQCSEDDIQSFGLGCTPDEPCPMYLELSDVEQVGAQIFAAGNIHSSTATLYAILLASSDNGRTWREPFERTRGGSLDRIIFFDFERGWVSGQLLQPLPRDPFLLITSDGGKTWRLQRVFDDGRPGSVQQIWFDSRNSGSLTFDRGAGADGPRYELYESLTGGDGWMIREAGDRPLTIKRMPPNPPETDLRLRTDGPTKSYRIERKQGARWAPVASFSVQLEACKPPAHELREPPPPEIDETKPPTPPASKGTLSLEELRRGTKK
jgi:hypothetical protein